MTTPEGLADTARARGVGDTRLLRAMRETPRAGFVPSERVGQAYIDTPIEISHGQTTSQPSLIAQMVEALGLRGDERVLEVGTGSGYQTALLARLCAEVVSVDRWTDMVEHARAALEAHGITNAQLFVGDGSGGVPDRAPFDGMVISAASPEVPGPLVDQLRMGGRIVAPVGPGGDERVIVYERSDDGLRQHAELTAARFVRCTGSAAAY